MIFRRDRFQLRIYDPIQALDIFKEKKIKVYNWHKVDDYLYVFDILHSDSQIIRQNFTEIKLIKSTGVLARLISLFHSKTTIISMVIAMTLFFFLSKRIFIIDIKGDATSLNPIVEKELNRLGIKKYSGIKTYSRLQQIESEALELLKEEIEYIEIRQVGVKVKVRFQKRRKEPSLPQLQGSLYATKDGIIKSFDIQKGMIMVKENQYVKSGTLLVNEKLMTTSGEEIHLGCEGRVMAYTWQRLEESIQIADDNIYDEADCFLTLLDKTRAVVSKELSEGEYLDSEMVLSFGRTDKIVKIVVNYILVEDITI